MSYEAAFRELSEAQISFWRRDEPALWLRDGQAEPDRIRVIFHEKWTERTVDGISVSDPVPMATFQSSDIAKIDATRAADPEPFKNERRDILTINGRRYAIESCTGDGYGWVNVKLIGPID